MSNVIQVVSRCGKKVYLEVQQIVTIKDNQDYCEVFLANTSEPFITATRYSDLMLLINRFSSSKGLVKNSPPLSDLKSF